MSDQKFEGWAIVEIMGHRVRAGRVLMDDSATIRVDIPIEGSDDVTEFYGRAAIFSLRPCTEEMARDVAQRYGDPRPIRPVEYRPDPPRLEAGLYVDGDLDQIDDTDFEVDEVPY